MKLPQLSSLLLIVIGLGFWSLAPYGGCACNNPLGPNSGPTPTATPTQGPFIDDWEDGDYLNKWGGSTVAVKDTYLTTMTLSLENQGSTLPGGSPARSIRVSGNIDREINPIQFPYVQVQVTLGSVRNILDGFSSYQGVRFSYKWASSPIAPGSFSVMAITGQTISNFAWYQLVVTPTNNNWNSVVAYFPNKVPVPKFAQPGWNTIIKTWVAPDYSGRYVDRIDFAVRPSAASTYNYDLWIDDVEFF